MGKREFKRRCAVVCEDHSMESDFREVDHYALNGCSSGLV